MKLDLQPLFDLLFPARRARCDRIDALLKRATDLIAEADREPDHERAVALLVQVPALVMQADREVRYLECIWLGMGRRGWLRLQCVVGCICAMGLVNALAAHAWLGALLNAGAVLCTATWRLPKPLPKELQ